MTTTINFALSDLLQRPRLHHDILRHGQVRLEQRGGAGESRGAAQVEGGRGAAVTGPPLRAGQDQGEDEQ